MSRPTPIVRKPVDGIGPYNALLYLLAEAPGPHEAARGVPMIGATGQVTRGALAEAGLSITRHSTDQVRINNVVPFNPGRLTDGYRKALVKDHWGNIDMDLARGDYKVIVACGGVALQRLTGLTNIKEEHGGVIFARDLPKSVLVAGEQRELGLDHLLKRNPDLLIVACEHPAAVMQGEKTQGRMVQIRKALMKAGRFALGQRRMMTATNPGPTIIQDFDVLDLDKVLAESPMIAVDTEFTRETHEPQAIQICGSAEPNRVYIWHPYQNRRATNIAAQHLVKTNKLKFAHYTPADIGTFRRLGYDVTGGDGWPNWICTLHAYAALYPDTLVGLNHAALDMLDDQRNWKHLNTLDPIYMALDVWNDMRLGIVVLGEIQAAGMVSLVTDEISVAVCEMDKLERGGMKVDLERQGTLIFDYKCREAEMTAEIGVSMADTFAKRGAKIKRKLDEIEALLAAAVKEGKAGPLLRCEYKNHGHYDGLRKKTWIKSDDCVCEDVFDQVSMLVDREPLRPFSPTNDHDMRWLLYDSAGLGLPKQRSRDTGNLTVNASAIRKITVKMLDVHEANQTTSSYYRENAPAIVGFIRDCKKVKQLRKWRTTFLEVETDADGYAHPEYRAFGAGTGRPAGGADDVLSDDKDQSAAYNALNIPKELRAIYIPDHPDWVWVSADYSALESWLTAYFANDDVLMGELVAFIEGRGPKPHAINAALLYECDVADVKRIMVPFQGNMVPAYDNGKRVSHLYAFGGTEYIIAENLWIATARAANMIAKLDAKYPKQVERRQLLSNDVFGTPSFGCARCGHTLNQQANCPTCAAQGTTVEMTYIGWETVPSRIHYTPFMRRRHYHGRRKDAANALASQDPQSCGASIFYRTSGRINGYEFRGGQRSSWPTPGRPGVDYRYATGSYDSFAVACPRDRWPLYARWLMWTMEQAWDQLGGLRIPAEVSVGLNLAPWDQEKNPQGLYDLPWVSEYGGNWTPLVSTREMWEQST